MNQRPDTVTVYADYVCPFCYLGYASFDRYQDGREEPLTVEWHPFDLRASKRRPDGTIDHTVEDGTDETYFEEAKQNVRQLADNYGVEMAQELAREVDSFPAQRAALRAQTDHPEAFDAFHRGLFDALWEAGRDISDPDVIAAIGSDAGLPEGSVAETLDDDGSADALEAAFDAARRDRITGVPTFVSGERAARGAVSARAAPAARGRGLRPPYRPSFEREMPTPPGVITS